ncbi:fascin domain-containing protein [Aureispira anguillae]|uniref:Uncharacterized protein n=1 Tax=Aureispira anguillae TaxID=2864201 RepID=A0A915YHU0_9BACT|nr:hypothetical protein [Aureispira anguillae]BDS13320.1 hypothetical protein AsAng_0040550 [Aureispira anguillae]
MHFILMIFCCLLLASRCAGPPPSNHVRACNLNPKKILLQSSSSRYVRLADQAPFLLIADAKHPALADTFCLCNLEHNRISLRAKRRYVTIHLSKNNQAIARQKHIDSWERINLEKKGDQVTFKAINDYYLEPSDSSFILAASSPQPSSNCLFNIIELRN